MSRPVFVDTSAWLAFQDDSDHYHQAALKIMPLLLESRPYLVTSNHVVGESYTAIRRALNHQQALDFIRFVTSSRKLERLFTPNDLEEAAYKLLSQYDDQDFSFVDATSFIWMKKLRIREAFAFDKHFTTAGFVLIG